MLVFHCSMLKLLVKTFLFWSPGDRHRILTSHEPIYGLLHNRVGLTIMDRDPNSSALCYVSGSVLPQRYI